MRRLFNNTVFTSLDYGTLILLNLIATPLLISNFGTAGYGAFVFLSIFSVYGALAVFDLGMEGALMNYVARFEATDKKDQIQDAFTLSCLFYGAIGVVLGWAVWFGTDLLAGRLLKDSTSLDYNQLTTAVLLVAVNVAVQFMGVPSTALLQGLRRFQVTKGVSVILNIARYSLVVSVALIFQRIDYAFAVVLGLSVLRLVVLTSCLVLRAESFRGYSVRLDTSLFRILLNYSSILFITRIIGLIHNQIDKLLIWYYLTATVMTVYDVIARPAMLLRVITSIVVSAVIPETARLHELGEQGQLDRMFRGLIRYSYLITLPLLAFIGPHISTLIGLWVGRDFRSDAPLSLILLAGFIVLPLPSIANTMMVGLEKVRQTIWIPITATSLNLVLSIMLLKSMGLAGLLVATLVSQVFGVVPYAVVSRKYLGTNLVPLARELSPTFLLAGLIGVVNWLLVGFAPFEMTTWLIVSVMLLSVNYLLNWRFLLSPEERSFIIRQLRFDRRAPGQATGL